MASLTVLISLVACATLATGAAGVRVELTRVHSSPFVRDAVRRDIHRHAARRLAASGDTVSAPTRKDTAMGEYLMTLAIGTPPLSYPAIADTGSDLIWTQCAPCGDQCFNQSTPLYNPANSTTFSNLPCDSPLSICAAASLTECVCRSGFYFPNRDLEPPASAARFDWLAGPNRSNRTGSRRLRKPWWRYNYTYGTGWTSGVQGFETFTFDSFPGIAFGCSNASSGHYFNGSSGLVGLGRGSLSLVSQLGADKFSYCLTPSQDTNSTSTLLLGPSASLNDTGVGSTPFITSPDMALTNTFYYLNLTGISLGTTALSIPADAFSLTANGTGGLFIDSGTTVTSLVDAAYQQVRAAVLSLVTLPTTDGSDATGLDLCFALPSLTWAPPALPSMMLHFDGADMVIPADSYMILESGLWCLAMLNNTDGEASVLGNYQQQNMHILYDISQETLSFAPANCSTF
ncbi:hypothetical protein HU200_051457 [Digitaria exilis]|uniref:Peptidase A1 domain-containing protein n=1 Tax=Digitaria exilis TaxID=1010633 RepID=A0A835E4V6_9POAL|nr:hypothetical protein HU200_051457 [Digitaria exilis]